MKKLLTLSVAALLATASLKAQNYRTAVGLGIDAGDGTMFGPSVKHFISDRGAIEGDLLFGQGATQLSAYYLYHGNFNEGSKNLKWYAGFGPSFVFGGGSTVVGIRPLGGLDFKIPAAPIQMNIDWRPALLLTNGTHFEGGRFGIGMRYAFGK